MKTVFILGAGASKQAGAPLMTDFLDRAYDLLRLKPDIISEVKSEFEEVFKAIAELQGVHSKAYLDLDNIEIVFGAIEMGVLLKRLGERDEDSITELRNSLVTLIYKTLENSILFPVKNSQIRPPQPYNRFMNILEEVENKRAQQDPHKFSFVTFNYDLCLDFSLNFENRQYDYCLSTDSKLDVSPLLKLHGSINWGLSDDQEIIPYNIREANFNFLEPNGSVKYDLGSKIHHKEYQGRALNGPPVIVPPTWNKNSYHGQLSHVWSKAAYEFAEAENIFIVGYSLPETDSFFRYLYALGSESSTRLRNFVVINPDTSGSVENRFRELIGKGIESRFKYIPETFAGGLEQIKSILLNP